MSLLEKAFSLQSIYVFWIIFPFLPSTFLSTAFFFLCEWEQFQKEEQIHKHPWVSQINLEYFRDMTALGLCGMQLTDISCIAMWKSNIHTSDLSDDNSNYLTLTASWAVKNLCKNVNQIPVILVQNNLISSIVREIRILLSLKVTLKLTLYHWPEHLRPSAGRYILLNLGT